MKPGDEPNEQMIFCRFIRRRDGEILDAHAYGKKTFRIVIRDKQVTHPGGWVVLTRRAVLSKGFGVFSVMLIGLAG